jgi:hypothetical protein
VAGERTAALSAVVENLAGERSARPAHSTELLGSDAGST